MTWEMNRRLFAIIKGFFKILRILENFEIILRGLGKAQRATLIAKGFWSSYLKTLTLDRAEEKKVMIN